MDSRDSISEDSGLWNRIALGRRASIAVWIAVMLPGMIMAVALGIETAGWGAAQVSAQRAADFSALAGAMNYKATTNKQTAATFAARVAQLNGATGVSSPTWNSTTNTVTDSMITAQIINGLSNSADTAIRVTVQKAIPPVWPPLGNTVVNYSVTGTSTVELVATGGAGSGGQPCLLALSSSGQITGQGSTNINMPNCTMRSNGTITFSGAGTLTTAGFYAGGAISIPGWFTVTGSEFPSDGTIPDPYASNSALQSALTTAGGLTGVTNISCGSTGNNCFGTGTNVLSNGGSCTGSSAITCTMYPGNYGSWTISSGGPYTFNLQPGLYLFNGPISLTQNSTTNGSAVTIVSSGAFTGSNTFNFYVTAPTVAQAALASPRSIPGVALAGSSTTRTAVSGSVNFVVAGAIYFPNAIFDASGSTSGSASSPGMGSTAGACMEIIASSIYTSGYSDYNSNCTSLGSAAFTSIAGTTTTTAQIVH
jgi:hypothetical protein